MDTRWSRRDVGLSVAVGVLVALPLVLVTYPPMPDLAFHEAGVSLLRHHRDAVFSPPGLYALNLGEPNQLFHLLAYALSYAMPVPVACRAVVVLTVVLTSAGASVLAAYLRVPRAGGCLALPLALGWMARWGLVANLLGFALLLPSLTLADRNARAPSGRTAAVATLALVVLFFAHESSAALYAVACVIFAVGAPRRPRPLALALTPALVALALAGAYHLRSEGLKAGSVLASTAISVPLARRLLDLPASLFSLGRWSAPLFAGCIASVTLLRWRLGPDDGRRPLPLRFLALGLLALAAYFVMPEALFGSTLVYQRFAAPGFAILALVALPAATRTTLPTWALAWLPLAMLAGTAHLFSSADRSARDLDILLARMADGAATAQLDLSPRLPSHVAPVVGVAARALSEHGGRLLFSFTDAPTYPLTMPPSMRWEEPVARMALTPFAFAPAHDLTRFRYVIARCTSARVRAVLPDAFAPEGALVVASGEWMLFESRLRLVSVTAPDARVPSPSPETLASRVQARLVGDRAPHADE